MTFTEFSDKRWERLDKIFQGLFQQEKTEDTDKDNETTYYDSLSPNSNQEYVAKLKADIMNLRKEYSRSRKDGSDENLVKRSFLEDMAKTKTNLMKNQNSKKRNGIYNESTKNGEAWFGSGRFQDSGERMRLGGGRRYSEGRLERMRKGRSQDMVGEDKNVRLKVEKENMWLKKEKELKHGKQKESTANMYKEIMDAVKVNVSSSLPFGNERMAAWLLESRLQ